MSEPSRSELPSSGRRRSSIASSSRHALGRSSEISSNLSRPSRRDISSSSPRRSHSTTGLPPRDEMDEETKARLARREERRRRREQERSEAERLPRRSSSLPQPQSPALVGNEKPIYFAIMERSSATQVTEDRPLDEEAADKFESLSAKKAAYLRAVEKREQRASRRHSIADAVAPDTIGSAESPPDHYARTKKSDDDDDVQSPDRSSHSGKSSKHRSSRESTAERKERKSSRRASIASTVDEGRAEKRRSGDADLSRSSSSGDKARNLEKRRSNESRSSTKEKKLSSRSKDDESKSHRSHRKHSSRSRDDESSRSKEKKRSRDDREHRSSRRSGDSGELLDLPPKDHKSRTIRGSDLSSSAQLREEFHRRRDEHLDKKENELKDKAKEEEYRRRREERRALREERRRLSGDSELSEKSRTRSASMPRYAYESSRDEKESISQRIVAGGPPTFEGKSIFGKTATREKSNTSADGGLFGSSDAEAARERLRERMLARKDASISDSEAASVSTRSRGMGADDVGIVNSRPKLVDVRRRGIASILKQQRTNAVDSTTVVSSSSSSSSESESEEETLPGDELAIDDEESSDGGDEENWTIRVSLISAGDLPLHVVPNMPLCPVLKFGLITLPPDEVDTDKTSEVSDRVSQSSPKEKSSMLSQIETSGLSSIPRARVRCTGNKMLSKRDNGSVEFHEEMRWDKVKRPMHAALVVELSAKALLPPTNLKESPFMTQPKPSSQSAPSIQSELANGTQDSHARQRSNDLTSGARSEHGQHNQTGENASKKTMPLVGKSTSPSISRSASTDGDDAAPLVHGAGLTGMRALWKRGRQQFEQRQVARLNEPEEGNPPKEASAGFLAGGKGGETSAGGEVQGFLSRQSAPDRNVPSLADENVALLRLKKRRKLEMIEDLRLGSLVIPLTRLPLEKAIQNKEVARIEQWYQLDSYDVLVPSHSTPTWRGKGATKPLPRRSPTVQLEITFSPPEVVDDSEDDMDDISISELNTLDDGAENEGDRPSTGAQGRPSLTDGAIAGTVRSFARRAAGRSFSRRVASEMRSQEKASDRYGTAVESTPSKPVKKVPEDPVLEPGLVDFICVVGASNIGDQKDDDGSRGWVETSPECSLLEQFPPNDEFHVKNGRNVALANKVEWFCFPEGWKLWRGLEPPSPADLNIKRFSSAAAANVLQSNAAFDACLGCTTSFSWFVIASNSDEYGSRNVKTYGAVIKFYVPAPKGIDQTQDDYAQTVPGDPVKPQPMRTDSTAKRLWVPMGICLTSNFPIVGVMEAMLLRICETLASADSLSSQQKILPIIHKDIANLIVNFQTPIPGVLHCSIPFLQGERLHITLPPPTGLPPLPHGSAVRSVCRLLGAEGINLMMAALLTECKIIVHSDEIANLAMVSEVTTALLYPFNWALPCIPVLPDAMLEFVEAPLSYFLGIPTSSLKLIDPNVLEDVVVVDLDSAGSSDYFDGRRAGKATKTPTPLPSSVATNISKGVFRLLREEGEVDEEYGASTFPGHRSLPRLESESLAEREFRIAVALQVCGLLRGYDDCLFKVSTSQPVFNRDKFLKTAPALFENQRGNLPIGGPGNGRGVPPRTLSPRSKRFLSILVNCQHFHQFLHALDEDECAFFNEVMCTFDMNDDQEDNHVLGGYGTSPTDEAAAHLTKALQKVEDKIPTYRVERQGKKKDRRAGEWDEEDELGILGHTGVRERGRGKQISEHAFPYNLLQPLCMDPRSLSNSQNEGGDASEGKDSSEGVHTLSVEYLMELEKANWRYEKLFQMPIETGYDGKKGGPPVVEVREKVKLKEAIGERRYRAWKLAQEQKFATDESSTRFSSRDILSAEANPALDLTSLLSSMADDATSDTSSVTQSTLSMSTQNSARASTLSPEQQRVADAKDRDILRRCLERAYEGSQKRSSRRPGGEPDSDTFMENGRDLVAEAETALRNPSAQRFLVSVLSQRSRLENQKKRRSMIEDPKGARRQTAQSSVSRLETSSFECLVRLCCAMLDSCMESKDYAPAYGLLTHTAGFCTVQIKDGRGADSRSDEVSQDSSNSVVYMTARIGLHPIFADLRLWEEVFHLHLKDRENDKNSGSGGALIGKANSNLVEYEAAVATLYEMLGFGIPAEELARFATRASEEQGWFDTERGHSLMMFARRLGVRREQESEGADDGLDLMRASGTPSKSGVGSEQRASPIRGGTTTDDVGELEWSEIGWCHPGAPSTVRVQYVQSEGDEGEGSSSKRIKRSAVTSIASFGSSIVASGGLDGSVFVAHTIEFGDDQDGDEKQSDVVHGIHLDWGSSGSRTAAVASTLSSMDGEYGVGAVSCLAAAKGAGYRSSAVSSTSNRSKDVSGKPDEEEFLSAMEGCRVVAGTTAGDLRVWTVKDVYAATVLAKKGPSRDTANANAKTRLTHGGSGLSSSYVTKTKSRGITDIAAGSAFSRLQFSLRGRALSGHRGGVSCMDVPSHIYRPDALVTGGADGFIKLWSLRQPMAARRAGGEVLPGAKASMFNTSIGGASPADQVAPGRASRSGDALSILSGHTGRVLCVKTAWHGDRLLSGGADRSVRIWDLAGSGGKCLNCLTGHLGWVTHAHYWGPNTVVTGSTDRSIALWDPRVRKSPLFILRYHYSPVSDLLVGSRTDPLMISAGADGTIATWDFRTLSGSNAKTPEPAEQTSSTGNAGEAEKQVKAVRTPVATMKHASEGKGVRQSAPVFLSRGVTHNNTVLSTGVDAIVREWDISSGRLIGEDLTRHCEGVSAFTTFSDIQNALGTSSAEQTNQGSAKHGGIITSSWDGTVRMRKFVRK